MNLWFKKVFSVILSICLIVSSAGATVQAKTGKVDGQQYEIVVNNLNIITAKQYYQGFEIYATLNKKTKEVTAEAIEKPNNLLGLGKSKKHRYKVVVQELDEIGNVEAIAKDIDTNQVFKIGSDKDHDKVVAQAPFVLIPIATALGSMLGWLFAAAATITVLGVTYTLVSDIASTMKNNRQYDYYQAIIRRNNVWVAAAFPNRAAAAAYLKANSKNDVFARTHSLAESIAKSVAGHVEYCTLPHNTDGFYPHYHPYRGSTKIDNHVFTF